MVGGNLQLPRRCLTPSPQLFSLAEGILRWFPGRAYHWPEITWKWKDFNRIARLLPSPATVNIPSRANKVDFLPLTVTRKYYAKGKEIYKSSEILHFLERGVAFRSVIVGSMMILGAFNACLQGNHGSPRGKFQDILLYGITIRLWGTRLWPTYPQPWGPHSSLRTVSPRAGGQVATQVPAHAENLTMLSD